MSHTLNKTQFDPTWTDPRQLEPQYGVGRVTAIIYWKSILIPDLDSFLEIVLDYSFQQTVNGIEAFVENPKIRNASNQDYDIRKAMEKDLGFRIDKLNYIE